MVSLAEARLRRLISDYVVEAKLSRRAGSGLRSRSGRGKSKPRKGKPLSRKAKPGMPPSTLFVILIKMMKDLGYKPRSTERTSQEMKHWFDRQVPPSAPREPKDEFGWSDEEYEQRHPKATVAEVLRLRHALSEAGIPNRYNDSSYDLEIVGPDYLIMLPKHRDDIGADMLVRVTKRNKKSQVRHDYDIGDLGDYY